MQTTVVNIRSGASYDVYVGRGRGSQWGNPWSHKDVPGTKRVATVEEAVARYRAELWQRVELGLVSLEDLASLRGKVLGCWCKPGPCHDDVIARAAEWAAEELRRRSTS